MKPDKIIISFIEEQKNMTIATSHDNIPHCACCFYAFMNEGNFIIFKSDKKTQHVANAFVNSKVAGTILPNIEKVGTIKGIQFTGKFKVPMGDFLTKAKEVFYNKYPFARMMPGDLWVIELIYIKMTNNTLGFGKKLIWEKDVK